MSIYNFCNYLVWAPIRLKYKCAKNDVIQISRDQLSISNMINFRIKQKSNHNGWWL